MEALGKMKEEARTQVAVDDDKLKDSTDAERTKIRAMRAYVESQDPSSKEEDDLMIRRFLRARDLDVQKASAMFLKYLKWRHSFVPNGFISPSEIRDELAHDKFFMQGPDKRGRPVAVFFAAKHFQSKDFPTFQRYIVFSLDKIFSRMPPGQEKFVAIADVKGWGYSNLDIRGTRFTLTILQDCFPERLDKLIFIHAPSIFIKAWKLISPVVDNNTRKKIMFAENKKIKSTLLEEIDESQLPEIYGGRLPLVPIQDA